MRLFRIPFPPVLATLAIFLAVLAQYVYLIRHQGEVAWLFLGAAIVLWLGGLVLSPTQVVLTEDVPPPFNGRVISKWLVVSGIGLAILAYLFSGENQFTSDGVLAWLSSVAVLLYAFWNPARTWDDWRGWFIERFSSARARLADGVHLSYRTLMFGSILLIGAFFFARHLDTVPAEMVSDHAEKILDIRDIENGARPVYLTRNNGSEALSSYLVAAWVALGDRPLDFNALKFVSAFFGWLLIPAVFLLARELFDDDVALLAAAFAAISKWSLGVARAGLPFATTALLVTLLLWFLIRAIKQNRRNDFLVAGVLLGAGFYASEPFRVMPILVIGFLLSAVLLLPSIRKNIRAFSLNSFLLFVLALAVLAPLVRLADDNPQLFLYHTVARIAGESLVLRGDAWLVLLQNLVDAAQMFTGRGDASWLTGVPGDPMLDYVMGGLFVLGISLALFRLVKSRDTRYVFLFLGLIGLLIPSALNLANPDDNPSAVYAAGAMSIVFIFVALPLAWGVRLLSDAMRSPWRRAATSAFLVVIFAVSARANYSSYFDAFDAVYRKASWNASEISEAARGFADSIGDTTHVWIIVYPYWVDARNVGIGLEEVDWAQVLPNADAALGQLNDPLPKLYILNPGDQVNLTRLREIFPNGRERAYHSRTPGHEFILFYVIGIPNL